MGIQPERGVRRLFRFFIPAEGPADEGHAAPRRRIIRFQVNGLAAQRIREVGFKKRHQDGDHHFHMMELSLRRANAVREALVARGINPARISVAGQVEVEPVVATSET